MMLKKRLISIAACISLSATLIQGAVYADVTVKESTFNTAELSSTWTYADYVEAVKTDLVPAGYAIRNSGTISATETTGNKNISVSKEMDFDFTSNDYYINLYFNMKDGTTAVSQTAYVNYPIIFMDGTTEAAKAGFINAAAGANYKPFVKIGKGSNGYDSTSPAPLIQTDTTYQLSVKITGGDTSKMTMDVYDVETGTKFSSTAEVEGSLTADSVKIESKTWGGVQTLSDFRITEVSTDEDKAASAAVFEAAKNISFENIPNEISAETASIILPEEETTENGSIITYQAADSSVIDSEGNVTHKVTDTRTFIKATVTNGAASAERTYAVTVKGTGSSLLAYEDFDGAGDTLSGYTPSADKGFAGRWKPSITAESSDTSGFDVKEIKGIRFASYNNNAGGRGIYNTLKTPIDMDSDNVYYASWVQGFESDKRETSDSDIAYIKGGFIKDSDNSKDEMSCVVMQNLENTIMPLLGMKTSGYLAYNTEGTINRGTLYNVLFKIKAGKTGRTDVVSYKLWPLGTQEPEEWTYTRTTTLTGEYSVLFCDTRTQAGNRIYFGDFKLECYAGDDVDAVENAFTAASDYVESGTAPEALEWPITNSTAEKSYNNMLKLRDKAYVSEFILSSGETRISRMSEIADGENVKITAVIKNDAGTENSFGYNVFAAVYDSNGNLESVKNVNAQDISAADANGTVKAELDLGQISQSADKKIKVFIWDTGLVPDITQITIGKNNEGIDVMKNY